MKYILLCIILLCTFCFAEEPVVDISLPYHVAVKDIAFIHFAPEQIEENPLNASAICRVFPSPSSLLEEHEIICFSNMEQYAVRYANGTRIRCYVESVEGTIGMNLLTPILQNSCTLKPAYIPFVEPDQHAQVDLFVENHAAICKSSVATMETCKSMDNHTYMELLAAYGFRGVTQIVVINQTSLKTWAFETVVNFIKQHWNQ